MHTTKNNDFSSIAANTALTWLRDAPTVKNLETCLAVQATMASSDLRYEREEAVRYMTVIESMVA